MENSIVIIGGIDYSDRLQNVKVESDLDGGSTSSVFGSVERETVTAIIYGEVKEDDYLTLKFETDDGVKDYGIFKIDSIEYDDKTTLTTVEAYTDLGELLDEFDMPKAKDTNELLEKLDMPKAPKNYPIKDTSDKYYENKLKLAQDVAALSGSFVRPKSENKNVLDISWSDFEIMGGKDFIASDPQIVEGDESNPTMIVDTLNDGREHVKVYGATPETKLVYKGDAFKGEKYRLSTKIDNKGIGLDVSALGETKSVGKGESSITLEGELDGEFEIKIGVTKWISEYVDADGGTISFVADPITFVDPENPITTSAEFVTIDENVEKDLISFELEPAELLEPITEVHMTFPYGDNISQGVPGSALEFSGIELVKDIREEILDDVLDLYKGFSYRKYESKHPGDPFIKPGMYVGAVDKDDKYHKILVTSRTFTDNGSWKMDVASDIPSQEEVNTNYIGTFEKYTGINVDKVNQNIEALIQGQSDVEDTISKINIDLQEIHLQVMGLSTNENIIPNLNGNVQSYHLWEWDNPANTLVNYKNIDYRPGLTSSTNFIIVDLPKSLSQWGLEFFNKGNARTGFGRVVPNSQYSYRGLVLGNAHNVKIKVIEYESLYGKPTTSKTFTVNKSGYNEFSVNFNESTQYVRLEFDIPSSVTTTNPWVVTEQMFNRGNPREWQESAGDVKIFAQSEIKMLDDEIRSTVEEVKIIDDKVEQNKSQISQHASQIGLEASRIDSLNNDIHNAGVEINAVDGVTTYGKKFRVMDSNRNKELLAVHTIAGQEQLVIDINNGSVGNFSIQDGVMEFTTPEYYRNYTKADVLYAQQIIRDRKTPTQKELLVYDVNNDGKITLIDLAMIQSHVLNKNKLQVPIKTHIQVGTKNGEVVIRNLFKNKSGSWQEGERSILSGNSVESTNIIASAVYTDSLAVGGYQVIRQSDGTLKATQKVMD